MPLKRMVACPVMLLVAALVLSPCEYSARGEPEENGNAAVSTPDENVRDMVETSLEAEADTLDELKTTLENLDQYEKAVDATLTAISLQHTAQKSLLLTPESDVQKIIEAQSDNASAIAGLSDMIGKAKNELASNGTLLSQVDEQILLNQKNLSTVHEQMPDNPLTAKLIRQIKKLDKLLHKKRDTLQKIAQIYEASLKKLNESSDRLTEMRQTFEKTISQKKKEMLFKRGSSSVADFNIAHLDEYLSAVPSLIMSNLRNDFKEIVNVGPVRVSLITLFVVAVLIAALRFKHRISQWCRGTNIAGDYPWRSVVIQMASRSLPLGWLTLVLYFFAFIQNYYATIFLSGIGFVLAYAWLWTRWGLDMITLGNRTGCQPLPEPIAIRLRRLMHIIRCLTVAAVFPIWIFGRTGIVSMALDFLFTLVLAVWAFFFVRRFRAPLPEKPRLPPPLRALSRLTVAVVYLIPLGGISISLFGFQTLSGYWLVSWGLSLSIILWSWITFNMIREWHARFRATSLSASGETGKNRPLMWFCIQISWLTWLWMTLVGLIFSWYFDKTRFLKSIMELMNLSLTLGSLDISLSRLLEAAVVLLLIHMLTRVWPKLFEEKFLADSGMNAGLKSSITVITTYVIWTFGFLMVLNILGVDFKSMAVAFGGLGIGLGFGLQAIFNNFFSGIILLFERPIQVGDVIEVGGVWGEVKKINVRATLIQTYDNATLLIPNSEFISGQVTNWSFKDFRVRRSINIGVAYGSDVELVQKTLFEIADTVQDVYKYPKPVVLFKDFGDSALLFQLRVWTHVDNGLTVETAIRFAVDREFRKNRIEIPFPQRDIHIRSVKDPESRPAACATTGSETPDAERLREPVPDIPDRDIDGHSDTADDNLT